MEIKGYEGYYSISPDGQVRSLPRVDSQGRPQGNIIMTPCLNKGTGYYHVCLKKDGKSKTCQIHTLVASHFLEKPEGKNVEVNHKDGNKADNSVENLEWIPHSENIKHQYTSLGRVMSEEHKEILRQAVSNRIITDDWRRDKSLRQSKCIDKAEEIYALRAQGLSQEEVASRVGVSQMSVSRFLRGVLKCQTLT